MTILQEIMTFKAEEVADMKRDLPSSTLLTRIRELGSTRSASEAFRAYPPNGLRSRILSEVKEASPSKGILRPNLEGVSLAREYEDAGATAISVLTDQHYFRGSFERLESIRPNVSLPLLAKEFIDNDEQLIIANYMHSNWYFNII